MTRGRGSPDGSTFVNKNGYHHTKVEGQWVLTARLVLEKKLGRKLREGERVKYIDNDRKNLKPDNVTYTVPKDKSKAAKRAQLEHQIEELQAQLDAL